MNLIDATTVRSTVWSIKTRAWPPDLYTNIWPTNWTKSHLTTHLLDQPSTTHYTRTVAIVAHLSIDSVRVPSIDLNLDIPVQIQIKALHCFRYQANHDTTWIQRLFLTMTWNGTAHLDLAQLVSPIDQLWIHGLINQLFGTTVDRFVLSTTLSTGRPGDRSIWDPTIS